MTPVYDLWFEREYSDREDIELHIDIYATEGDARKAVDTLRNLPGFRDFPDGFNIYPVELGRTGWQEGFVTMLVPEKEYDATDRTA